MSSDNKKCSGCNGSGEGMIAMQDIKKYDFGWVRLVPCCMCRPVEFNKVMKEIRANETSPRKTS